MRGKEVSEYLRGKILKFLQFAQRGDRNPMPGDAVFNGVKLLLSPLTCPGDIIDEQTGYLRPFHPLHSWSGETTHQQHLLGWDRAGVRVGVGQLHAPGCMWCELQDGSRMELPVGSNWSYISPISSSTLLFKALTIAWFLSFIKSQDLRCSPAILHLLEGPCLEGEEGRNVPDGFFSHDRSHAPSVVVIQVWTVGFVSLWSLWLISWKLKFGWKVLNSIKIAVSSAESGGSEAINYS